MGYGTGFFSFLLLGLQFSRNSNIPHYFSFSLTGRQSWVNFVGLSLVFFLPLSRVSGFSFFRVLYSFQASTL